MTALRANLRAHNARAIRKGVSDDNQSHFDRRMVVLPRPLTLKCSVKNDDGSRGKWWALELPRDWNAAQIMTQCS